MNLTNMEYFLEVCKYGTITAASEALYVSQQALSQTIKKIEDEFGQQLFYRSNPLQLTEAGKKVQETFQNILAEYKSLSLEFQKHSSNHTIVVGYVGSIKGMITQLMEEFQRMHPDFNIQVLKLKENQIPENVSMVYSKKKMADAYNAVMEYSNQVCLWIKNGIETSATMESIMNMMKELKWEGKKHE